MQDPFSFLLASQKKSCHSNQCKAHPDGFRGSNLSLVSGLSSDFGIQAECVMHTSQKASFPVSFRPHVEASDGSRAGFLPIDVCNLYVVGSVCACSV